MMKFMKTLVAFVLVAGLACVGDISAKTAQRSTGKKRVGRPTTSYKQRLERIKASGGFNARSGTRGGAFERSEGMHPQELELMVLQRKELTSEQRAELGQFHEDNPGVAEQFNEALIAEGLAEEVEEAEDMPTTTEVETATEAIKTEENSSKNKPLLPQEKQAEELLAEGKTTEEELVAQRKALEDAATPEILATLDKQIEEQKTYRERLTNSMRNAGERAKAIAEYTASTAKSYATVKGIGTIILVSAGVYTGAKIYQQRGFLAGLVALKNEAARAGACVGAAMCTAAGKFTSLFSRKGANTVAVEAGATVLAQQAAENPDLAAQLAQYSSIMRGEEISANVNALNEVAKASLEAFAESGESYVDVLARMKAEKAAESSVAFYETMNAKVNEYLYSVNAGVADVFPLQ